MNKMLKAIAVVGVLALPVGSALANPPDWAPAHGHHAKHRYVYYPAHRIYYEPVQQTWFWFDSGNWRVGATLPVYYEQYTHGGVTIELDADMPYEQQAWVEQHYGHPVVVVHRHRGAREYEYDGGDDNNNDGEHGQYGHHGHGHGHDDDD